MISGWLSRLLLGDAQDSSPARGKTESTKPSDPETLARAKQSRLGGDLVACERLLMGILSRQPEDQDALLELAYLFAQRGDLGAALDGLEKLNSAPDVPADALRAGADLARKRGEWSKAIEWAGRVARLPAAPLSDWYSLARLLRESHQPEKALAAIGEGLQAYPDDVHLLIERGLALRDLDRYEEAEAEIARARETLPEDFEGVFAHAKLLKETGRPDEALALAARFAADNPNRLRAQLLYAGLLPPPEALKVYEAATVSFPQKAETWVNLAHSLCATGDFGRAVEVGRHGVELAPSEATVHVNLAMTLLTLGLLNEGWQHYQWRYQATLRRDYPIAVCPGNPLIRFPEDLLPLDFRGKRITLVEDQGVGDELSFLRFAPLLRQRGAHVTYVPDPKLASMVDRAGAVDVVTPVGETAPPDTEIYLAPGDLPLMLGIDEPGQLPPPLPLTARPESAQAIVERVALAKAGGRPLIGVTWRGGINSPRGDRLFKLVALEALARLLRDLPVEVAIVQRNPDEGEIERFAAELGRPVHDFSDLNADLEEMLALLDELHDYITVSNTNVHLRAGLGKPARVLVPFPPDYRWMTSGDESPWFPGFGVYRQTVEGDWNPALDALQADLWRELDPSRAPPPSRAWPVAAPVAKPASGHRFLRLGSPAKGADRLGAVNIVTIDSLSIGPRGEPTAMLASTRYRALIPGAQLARRGYDVRIFPRPQVGWNDDATAAFPAGTVVFSKSFSADNVMLAKLLKQRGDRIVVDVCDNHFDHPQFGLHLRALCETATQVVASSPEMARVVQAETGRSPRIVEDPLEGPRGTPEFSPRFPAIKALWFGHPSNLGSLRDATPQLAAAASRYPIDLTILTRSDAMAGDVAAFVGAAAPDRLTARVIDWSTDETWRQLAACDLVVIPSTLDGRSAVKSPNRLLEAIWAGRFVVAHPVPSYQAFGDYCRITDDLGQGIVWAIENRAEVLQRVRSGQEAIAFDYSAWKIADDWANVVGSAAASAVPPFRLNLGCGDKILPGYLNIDIAATRRGTRPDVISDLRQLAFLPDDAADEVLSVHVVEHFSRWEIEQVLREWLRVLKPGGRMVIECPNLASACERFLHDPSRRGEAGPEGRETMWVFYGDPAWQDPLMTHRWGYSPESLRALLEAIGLDSVHVEPAQFKMREPRDMRLVGVKPRGEAGLVSVAANTESAATPGVAPPSSQPATPRQAWDEYFRWFHETGVWKRMSWQGIRTLKFPGDMWNYQEIIFDLGIDWVVETGTRHGGSALFFAQTLAAREAVGRVFSIDVDADARQTRADPRISFVIGDSASQEVVSQVTAQMPDTRGPLFLILDSDHSKTHVLRELKAWVPVLRRGDYLVVEDTCVNGHPVRPDHGPGPMEAIAEWLKSDGAAKLRPDEVRCRKFGATAAPGGYFRIV